ncbi:MAG: hypothetical protein J3K34DRAFT_522471 [Monoraphidium minutum]|nr:MAG: hypothetical protein J3K34DRAFT_522471 [Monoraphidium minutum]
MDHGSYGGSPPGSMGMQTAVPASLPMQDDAPMQDMAAAACHARDADGAASPSAAPASPTGGGSGGAPPQPAPQPQEAPRLVDAAAAMLNDEIATFLMDDLAPKAVQTDQARAPGGAGAIARLVQVSQAVMEGGRQELEEANGEVRRLKGLVSQFHMQIKMALEGALEAAGGDVDQ